MDLALSVSKPISVSSFVIIYHLQFLLISKSHHCFISLSRGSVAERESAVDLCVFSSYVDSESVYSADK